MADPKPGDIIRDRKEQLKDEVVTAIREFRDATDVTVQSVHYYIPEPDPKVLDLPKSRVDIILRL